MTRARSCAALGALLLMLALGAATCARAQSYPTFNLGGIFGAKHSINLVVFAEGWTEDDISSGKFASTARGAISGLFKIPPYDTYENYIRVLGVGTPSQSHGCKRTGERVYRKGPDGKLHLDRSTKFQEKETYFGIAIPPTETAPNPSGDRFKVDDFASYAFVGEGVDKLKKLLEEFPCDYAVLITPDDDLLPNGRALKKEDGYPCPVVVINACDQLGLLTAHELGHAMFRLGDEYSGGGSICKPGQELPYPNVSIYNDQRNPWSYLFDCVGQPIVGGTCGSACFHPTGSCVMGLVGSGGGEQFCDVCLDAMTHRIGELASLVQYTEPGGPLVTGVPSGSWIFKVNCRGNEKSDYTGCWFIDGKSMGEGTKTATSTGPHFELAFSVKVGLIDTGLHKIEFTVVNNHAPTNAACKKHTGKTPNVKTWRMVSAPVHLGIPLLESSESWE